MNEYEAEVERINGNVASTYTALSEMGATMPAQQNSDNLPGTVRTVPQGGGSSVQTDWNQTDETAPDFLKNKPFGESDMVLFPADTVDVSSGMADIVTLASAGVGNKVTVTINNSDVYECIVQECMGFPAIGNVDAFNGTGDTGEPFIGIWMSETAMSMMYMGGESYIRLEIEGEKTTMLPEKYYNKMTMLYSDGVYLYSDIALTTKLTAEELSSFLGKTPISIILAGSFMLLLSGGKSEDVGYATCYLRDQLFTLHTAEYTPPTT